MGSGLLFYFKIYPHMQWNPDFSYNFGSATHYMHPDGSDFSDDSGIPLNREWSVNFSWLCFYVSITLTKELPYENVK